MYASAPQTGGSAAVGRSFVDGAELALEQSGRRAGEFQVGLRPLDSASPDGAASPEAADANARRAADDPDAIAYLGEVDPRTAAVSLPVLNEAGLAQVGAAGLPAGLTRAVPSALAGEPERHYPTETRHFVRIVPSDEVQAAGVAQLMRADGCASVFVLVAPGGGGPPAIRRLSAALEAAEMPVDGEGVIPAAGADEDEVAELAGEIRAAGTACIGFAGRPSPRLDAETALFSRLGPRLRLYADEWLLEPGASRPTGLGGELVAQARAITGAALDPTAASDELTAFRDGFADRYERPPDPWALYGYEAMSLVLDAIRRAGTAGDDRRAVVRELFATRDRRGVLGRYSIDPQGDTTQRRLGVWALGGPAPGFERALELALPTATIR